MSDLAAIARWLIALEAIGWGLYPLLFLTMPGLRDRGLTLAKPFALLALVFPVWLLTSLGPPWFSLPALLLSGGLLMAGGWVLALRHRAISSFLRDSLCYVILMEVIFVAAFLAYCWLRGFNPEILGTEKPMESGFLAAAIRETVIPPNDQWLSGYGINYYYLGYILIAALAKLTALSPSVAFNLGLATIFSLALLGATGLTGNLLALASTAIGTLPRARTLLVGLLGGYLLTIAGNMYAARDIVEHGRAAIDAWWWGGLGWKSSRVILDNGFPPGFGGPYETINEFPFFSFILGDLHAHVLALPFVLLALGFALDIFAAPLFARARTGLLARARLTAAALSIGALYALNSWDLPTYATIYLAAGALPFLLARQPMDRRAWLAAGGFLLGCLLLYAPFYAHFTPLIGGEPFDLPEPWASLPLVPRLSTLLGLVIWTKTSADQFFTIYLLFWLVGLIFLAWRWLEGRRGMPADLTRPLFALLGLALLAIILQMPVAFFAGLLLLLAGAIFRQQVMLPLAEAKTARADAIVVLFFAVAFALVLGCEVFFIHDVFGTRMNTVFKVYYQAWTLLAIGAGYAIPRIVASWSGHRNDFWRAPALAATALLLLASLAYPIFGGRARTEEFRARTSLDGLDFVRTALPDEWQGIVWVREHVAPGAVVAEAPGCSYGEFRGLPHDRVSTFAGVTTPLGWGGHEQQWRGGSPALLAELGPRGAAVNQLFSTTDPNEALAIMDRYAIDYVYVGYFERNGYGAGGIGADCQAGGRYPAAGLAKFDPLLERVFTSEGGMVTIYRRR